jgi:hypothetical protein
VIEGPDTICDTEADERAASAKTDSVSIAAVYSSTAAPDKFTDGIDDDGADDCTDAVVATVRGWFPGDAGTTTDRNAAAGRMSEN